MAKRFLRATLLLLVVNGLMQVAGRVLSRRYALGDERTDDFRLAAIATGARFRSRAAALRRGSCVALWGGAKVDLRDTQLDPRGAELRLDAVMGGIEVRVPAHWQVDMDTRGVLLGGADLRVPPDARPGEDAPLLVVHANAKLGGIVVDSRP